MTNSKEIYIPFIGIVLKTGYIESYDYKTAVMNNFHHTFIMSSKSLSELEYDDVLRFVKVAKGGYYALQGEPALDPFTIGKRQISIFAAHCIENGVDPNTRIKIRDHKLNTRYEDQFIGCLKEFI